MLNTEYTLNADSTLSPAEKRRERHKLVPSGPVDFSMPKIELPNALEIPEGKDCPTIKIETPEGALRIDCYPGWFECFGTADALAEAGFLSLEWLPGLPGNNKTQQKVLFTDNGPCLVIGHSPSFYKQGTRPRCITVSRRGKKFVVQVPTTEDQEQRIRDCENEYEEEKKQIAKRQSKEKRYSNPENFKDFALRWGDVDRIGKVFDFVFSGKYEFEEYGEVTLKLDDYSRKEIVSVYAELYARLTNLVKNAKVIEVSRTPAYQSNGNVLIADFRNGRAKDGSASYV